MFYHFFYSKQFYYLVFDQMNRVCLRRYLFIRSKIRVNDPLLLTPQIHGSLQQEGILFEFVLCLIRALVEKSHDLLNVSKGGMFYFMCVVRSQSGFRGVLWERS